MSALPPKADFRPQSQNVWFGPVSDIRRLFEYMVGDREEVLRHFEV